MSTNILQIWYWIWQKGKFSLGNGFVKNFIIFGVNISSSVYVYYKKKDILILGDSPTQWLDDTTLTAEKKHSINFTESNKNFCLSLHYNGANSYLFVNGTEIVKFKGKDPEINAIPLCLGNILKDFFVDNMKTTGLNGYVYDFSADYDMILLQLMVY